jgi:hypothetical protein
MKILWPMAISAGTWLIPFGGSTQDTMSATIDARYDTIAARNMFGLVPIGAAESVNRQSTSDPPFKIIPNGIMTIFGQAQVLFKVSNAGEGHESLKDDKFVLSEGETQNEIAVIKIDREHEIVTFNNHGVLQVLPLVHATSMESSVGQNDLPPEPFTPAVTPRGRQETLPAN